MEKEKGSVEVKAKLVPYVKKKKKWLFPVIIGGAIVTVAVVVFFAFVATVK